MNPDFTGTETYQEEFDPRAYCDVYYGADPGILKKDGYLKFALNKLHETFTSGGVKGDVLLDIGHGPTIYQDLSACEAFNAIIGADYTDQNRAYYEKCINNEPGTFDWEPCVKYVCELEGKSGKEAEKREKLRRAFQRTVKCDVTKSSPLEPLDLPKVDCILTTGCLECACKDLDAYRRVLRNISTLLKIGGHLIITEILGCSFYVSGGKQFSCLTLDEAFLREAIPATGFVLEDFEVVPREFDPASSELCDHTSSVFLRARKIKDI